MLQICKCVVNQADRPAISGNDTLNEPVCKYMVCFIKASLPSLPAYAQDTSDVLSKVM